MSQSQAEDFQYSDSDGSHIENIKIDEDAGEGVNDYSHVEGVDSNGLLSKDMFFETFKGIFNISGSVTRLNSLKIDDGDESARLACDAIYDTANETPFLRFLIEPSNIWVQRGLCIAMFTLPKVAAVQKELQARKTMNITPDNQDNHA